MKRGARRIEGPGALELIEEAMHLLRMNAGVVLPVYYLGSLPFVLGLLYFWSDMSRSPFAEQHVVEASLGMALLFLWMKFWQAIFVDGLRARISANPPTRWNLRRGLRVLLIQTAIQPSGMLLLPLSALPMFLPFPWVYAFYQNVTALTDGETAEIRKPLKRAWVQAGLWPGQNVTALIVMAGFGLYVTINLMTVAMSLPSLAKTLFGIESVYSQSAMSMLNTTFLATIWGITYLCVDPILKTIFLLRCFYGESLKSGEDLKAELKRVTASARLAVAGLVFILCFCCAGVSRAADGAQPAAASPASPAKAATVSASELNETINQVIHEPKYTWRTPREGAVEEDKEESVILKFIRRALHAIGHWIATAINWVIDMINKLMGGKRSYSSSSGRTVDWMTMLHVFMFGLLAVVVCALAILLIRVWRNRTKVSTAVASEAIAATPDLKDENVGADQLPEDGWIKLGRELLSKGELRLAMRAFYFASLSHLAARNLVTIAKFKSNRDYERELGRRGHSLPDLLSMFGENVLVFDRTWYGSHSIDNEMVGQFLANVERIKTV